MENRQPLTVYRNKDNWLSEIGYLYFQHQINYSSYDFTGDSWQVEDGIDLIVLNKQLLPYYVLTYANDYPYDYLFLSLKEDGQTSRLLTSKSDFVFFYNLNQKEIYIIDLPLLQETYEYQKNNDWAKYKPVFKRDETEGIQIPVDDKILKPILGTYKLKEQVYTKAIKIQEHLKKDLPFYDKNLPLRRLAKV
mgnify:CR=1 FL=1|tara:strand:+ start:3191 stop:3766 length:576 start_codon:yes stop_codon:yes gene_type:complete